MMTLEFLFDYASPFAFLANEIVPRKFDGAEIVWRPVYLRALESFSDGFPFKAAKAQYLMQDLLRCSEHEGVAWQAPATFPINGLYALRGALVAQKIGKFASYHEAMFRAVWRESREVDSARSVAEIARGLALPEVADGIDDPTIKAELREATDAAVKRGVFGVPTFFVGGDMFFGHDRMDYVARALA
jgi:2-hydroxychromene-2-carboxylate isomerase